MDKHVATRDYKIPSPKMGLTSHVSKFCCEGSGLLWGISQLSPVHTVADLLVIFTVSRVTQAHIDI